MKTDVNIFNVTCQHVQMIKFKCKPIFDHVVYPYTGLSI